MDGADRQDTDDRETRPADPLKFHKREPDDLRTDPPAIRALAWPAGRSGRCRARRTDQMFANYQMRELGGEGYLPLLELLPDGETMHVRSDSPLYDRCLLGADQQYTIELDVE